MDESNKLDRIGWRCRTPHTSLPVFVKILVAQSHPGNDDRPCMSSYTSRLLWHACHCYCHHQNGGLNTGGTHSRVSDLNWCNWEFLTVRAGVAFHRATAFLTCGSFGEVAVPFPTMLGNMFGGCVIRLWHYIVNIFEIRWSGCSRWVIILTHNHVLYVLFTPSAPYFDMSIAYQTDEKKAL